MASDAVWTLLCADANITLRPATGSARILEWDCDVPRALRIRVCKSCYADTGHVLNEILYAETAGSRVLDYGAGCVVQILEQPNFVDKIQAILQTCKSLPCVNSRAFDWILSANYPPVASVAAHLVCLDTMPFALKKPATADGMFVCECTAEPSIIVSTLTCWRLCHKLSREFATMECFSPIYVK